MDRSCRHGDGEMTGNLFSNDDACGDWVVPLVHGLEFQVVNALSALCFVVAGMSLVLNASTPYVRGYGAIMIGVGIGSFSFHATSSLSGFLVDIVPMAVTAALMLFRGLHVLQVQARQCDSYAETKRWCVAIGCAFFAVYIPWAMILAGVSHSIVWGVWALLFGSMGAFFGVVCLVVFIKEDILKGTTARDLAVSIACVLLGLGFTLHSFIPGMCHGWRRLVPSHALWHLFSSVTANRCGCLLDTLTKLVEAMEWDLKHPRPEATIDETEYSLGASSSACKRNKDKVKEPRLDNLFIRLLKRDLLPSQFSM